MQITPFTNNDILQLPEINPPDWPNIQDKFEYYCSHKFCYPFKLSEGDKLIGSGVYILHKDVAWLAHIIVHLDYRNQGLGKIITQYLVNAIDKNRHPTIYLLATELGEPVYSKIGFIFETDYLVYKKPQNILIEFDNTHCFAYNEKYKEQIIQLDLITSGENRFFRLDEYLSSAIIFEVNNIVEGYYLPDFGEGLIIAKNENAGITLMKLRLQTQDNGIFPMQNSAAIQLMHTLKFPLLKKIKRMRLGTERSWKPEFLYNRSGGNIG